MTIVRLRAIAVAALVLMSRAPIAHAAEPSANPNPDAMRTFEEGRGLVEAGDLVAARAKFRASVDIEPSVGALLNLADCHEKLGEHALAYRRLRQAELLAIARSDKYGRAAFARSRAAALRSSVGMIDLVFPEGTSEAFVTIDAQEPIKVAPRELVAVEPGTHKLVVARTTKVGSGEEPRFETKVTLQAGAPPSVIEVVWTTTKTSPPPPSTPPMIEPSSSSSLLLPALVVGGVGAVSLVVGGVFGILTLSKRSDLEALCPSYPTCGESRRAQATTLDDDARTTATLSTITVISGVVLVAVGVGLYVFAGSSDKKSALLNGGTLSF